jgi:dephospho-CoA kinase
VLTVALTGGIACGKSVVAQVLREKGCFVHSADLAARELMAPAGEVWRAVVAHFGRDILGPDGAIDRRRLGAIVFADAAERAFLDALVHPRVLEKVRELVAEQKRLGRRRIFISEAALVFEAGFEAFFDRIVVVSCREDVRTARLMAREGIGRDEALRRIGSQMPQEEKTGRADYVIDASGTLAETVEQTERVYAMLVMDEALEDRGRSGESAPA